MKQASFLKSEEHARKKGWRFSKHRSLDPTQARAEGGECAHICSNQMREPVASGNCRNTKYAIRKLQIPQFYGTCAHAGAISHP